MSFLNLGVKGLKSDKAIGATAEQDDASLNRGRPERSRFRQ